MSWKVCWFSQRHGILHVKVGTWNIYTVEWDIYEWIYVYVNKLAIAPRYPKNPMDALEKNIISILREQYQFNFTLDVIYYVTVMVFYDFPHTNIPTIWYRLILICLVKIQNYTSLSDPLYKMVIIHRLKYQICCIIRIPRSIIPSLVPCSGIFNWGDLTSINMSWQCIASYMHHVKVIWTGWI